MRSLIRILSSRARYDFDSEIPILSVLRAAVLFEAIVEKLDHVFFHNAYDHFFRSSCRIVLLRHVVIDLYSEFAAKKDIFQQKLL